MAFISYINYDSLTYHPLMIAYLCFLVWYWIELFNYNSHLQIWKRLQLHSAWKHIFYHSTNLVNNISLAYSWISKIPADGCHSFPLHNSLPWVTLLSTPPLLLTVGRVLSVTSLLCLFSLTLKMKVVYSSETPVNVYQTAQNHILEVSTEFNALLFINFLAWFSEICESRNQSVV
jgi:hypothetical protein